MATKEPDDIQAAKAWHKQHRSSRDAWEVLKALLQISCSQKTEADPYVVDQAKLEIRNLPADEHRPLLVGTLVEAHADAETIAMARESYLRTNSPWTLISLLKVAPDAELTEKAHKVLDQLIASSLGAEQELLYALLQADPSEHVLRVAKRWLRKNPSHAHTKSIRSLLAKFSADKRVSS